MERPPRSIGQILFAAVRSGTTMDGVSLVEVCLAAVVLAVAGVAIQGTMVSTLRGIEVDRAQDVVRNLTLDLLERFCHPYSDVEAVFPAQSATSSLHEINVDEALEIVAVPEADRPRLRALIAQAGLDGFSLVLERGLLPGAGDPARAGRLHLLWVRPRTIDLSQHAAGAFRVFSLRGE